MVTFLRAFWLALLWQVGLQAWYPAVFLEYPFILRISSTSPMFCAPFSFQACFSLDWNTFSSSFLGKSPFFKITHFCWIYLYSVTFENLEIIALQTLTALFHWFYSQCCWWKIWNHLRASPFCTGLILPLSGVKGPEIAVILWCGFLFISCTGHSVPYELLPFTSWIFSWILSSISTVLFRSPFDSLNKSFHCFLFLTPFCSNFGEICSTLYNNPSIEFLFLYLEFLSFFLLLLLVLSLALIQKSVVWLAKHCVVWPWLYSPALFCFSSFSVSVTLAFQSLKYCVASPEACGEWWGDLCCLVGTQYALTLVVA